MGMGMGMGKVRWRWGFEGGTGRALLYIDIDIGLVLAGWLLARVSASMAKDSEMLTDDIVCISDRLSFCTTCTTYMYRST